MEIVEKITNILQKITPPLKQKPPRKMQWKHIIIRIDKHRVELINCAECRGI